MLHHDIILVTVHYVFHYITLWCNLLPHNVIYIIVHHDKISVTLHNNVTSITLHGDVISVTLHYDNITS